MLLHLVIDLSLTDADCGWTDVSAGAWDKEASYCEVWHGWTAAVRSYLHHLVSTDALLTVGNNLCARSAS